MPVSPAAVDAVQALVHGCYAAVLHEVVACYRAEADLRALRGDRHRLILQPRHVVPHPKWPADWNERKHRGGDGEA